MLVGSQFSTQSSLSGQRRRRRRTPKDADEEQRFMKPPPVPSRHVPVCQGDRTKELWQCGEEGTAVGITAPARVMQQHSAAKPHVKCWHGCMEALFWVLQKKGSSQRILLSFVLLSRDSGDKDKLLPCPGTGACNCR